MHTSLKKKASPASPSIILRSVACPFTSMSTIFSEARRTFIFPKRTWKGVHFRVPSGCSTTIMSIAPLRVEWLMCRMDETRSMFGVCLFGFFCFSVFFFFFFDLQKILWSMAAVVAGKRLRQNLLTSTFRRNDQSDESNLENQGSILSLIFYSAPTFSPNAETQWRTEPFSTGAADCNQTDLLRSQ